MLDRGSFLWALFFCLVKEYEHECLLMYREVVYKTNLICLPNTFSSKVIMCCVTVCLLVPVLLCVELERDMARDDERCMYRAREKERERMTERGREGEPPHRLPHSSPKLYGVEGKFKTKRGGVNCKDRD